MISSPSARRRDLSISYGSDLAGGRNGRHALEASEQRNAELSPEAVSRGETRLGHPADMLLDRAQKVAVPAHGGESRGFVAAGELVHVTQRGIGCSHVVKVHDHGTRRHEVSQLAVNEPLPLRILEVVERNG